MDQLWIYRIEMKNNKGREMENVKERSCRWIRGKRSPGIQSREKAVEGLNHFSWKVKYKNNSLITQYFGVIKRNKFR